MKIRAFIALILSLYCTCNILAQNSDWIYLSKSLDISSFAEEGNYMWIGNEAGIVKLNMVTGTKVHYNKANCPIPDNWVNAIAIDKNGVKWFGTWNAGIAEFDGTNWNTIDTSNSPLLSQTINALSVDSSNNLWAVVQGELLKYDGINWTVYNSSNSALPGYVGSIYTDGNKIWVGTSGGLAKFDGTNWSVYNTSNSNISSIGAAAISKDRLGNIWLLHSNGVEKFNGSTFTLFNNTNTNIQNINNYSMTIDTNNIIWTACISYISSSQVIGGAMSFNGSYWTKYDTSNSSLSDTDYGVVYADKSNSIWLGGSNSGMVDKKTGSLWTNYNPSSGILNGDQIRQIAFDRNSSAFIGTYSYSSQVGAAAHKQELVKYDWNTWTNLNNYTASSWAISSDKYGNIYVKNPNEIDKFDGSSWTTITNIPALETNFSPCTLTLNAFATDSISGGIWMDYLNNVYGSYNSTTNSYNYYSSEGLAYYNGINWTVFNHSNSPIPDSILIDFIKVDHSNNIWLSTNKGLIKYDGINWTIFNTSNSSLTRNDIGSFTFDASNNIWFSNGNFGFVKFDGTTCANYPHPYLNTYIGQGNVEIDIDGKIWLQSSSLISFDGTNWKTFNSLNSAIPDFWGLRSLSIDRFGNKWVGTDLGVLIYKEGGVETSSISNVQISNPIITIYPNPSDGIFKISGKKSNESSIITVYNLIGENIYSGLLDENIQTMEINQPNGIYLIMLQTKEGIFNSKLMIQK